MPGFIGYLVQLGAAGAVIYVVILFLKFLAKERERNDTHSEKVFKTIADSSERNTEALTTSITGLTKIVQAHDVKTDINVAECKGRRAASAVGE